MKYEDLTPEQMEKARSCKTTEELLALAKEEGFELSDAELGEIAGGNWNKCSYDGDSSCPDFLACYGDLLL